MQFKFKEFEKAVQSLQKAIDLREGNYAVAFNGLGSMYCDLKRYDDAIASYLNAIDLDPSYASAYGNLGNTYNTLKRYDDAIASYLKVLQIDPDDDDTYGCLGWAYLLQNQIDQAKQYFEKVIEINEKSWAAFLSFGILKAQENNLKEAEVLWQKSMAILEEEEESDQNNTARVFLSFLLGNIDQSLADIKGLIADGTLEDPKDLLEMVEILATCPQPPERIEDIITLLRDAIATFNSNSTVVEKNPDSK